MKALRIKKINLKVLRNLMGAMISKSLHYPKAFPQLLSQRITRKIRESTVIE